jgi:hypothetical protein
MQSYSDLSVNSAARMVNRITQREDAAMTEDEFKKIWESEYYSWRFRSFLQLVSSATDGVCPSSE